MVIRKLETWKVERNKHFFDSDREAGSTMPWDVVVLKLTDEDGIEGIATALGARSGHLTETYLHEVIAPVILGKNAYDREAIWHQLWTIDRHLTFFPVYLPGPVDVALWDMAAKKASLPLYRLLGACRTTLPAYASGLFHADVDDYVAEAMKYKSMGITAYKSHPPGPWQKDIEISKAIREAVGDEYILMCDPVAEYTLDQAIKVGRALEKLNYQWFEEPFRDFEIEKYARLCEALDIPVANTETTRGAHWGVAQYITNRATDIVRADVSWKSGITGTLKIAHLAEAHGLNCEIHTTTMGYMDHVNLHVSCSIRNCEFFELFVPEEEFRFPSRDRLPVDSNGLVHVPDIPGAGANLDWSLIDQGCTSYRIKEL
jgi:L-alanine-DL-glutamate epimerase-like enolase superfamily enzyme